MNIVYKNCLKLSFAGTLASITSSAFAGNPVGIGFAPANATAVPTLSSYMLIILSILLFVVALRVSKQKGAGKIFTLMLGVTILTATTGGFKLVSDLQAGGYVYSISTAMEPSEIFEIQGADNRYTNDSGVDQKVVFLNLPSFCPSPTSGGSPVCTSSTILSNNSSCDINCPFEFSEVSDRRLKHSINPLTKLDSNIQIYSFKYNEGNGETFVGVMAQDLLKDDRYKHAVNKMPNDYYGVNYQSLGLKMIKLEQWQKSPDAIYSD